MKYFSAVLIFFVTALFSQQAFSYNEAAYSFEAARILSHIRYLSSDELGGRLAGTDGAGRAARYIADFYRNRGLEPYGDNGTYYQNFNFVNKASAGESCSLVISTGSHTRTLRLEHDYYPLGFSSNGITKGDVVFAGYGITAPELDYDDYSGIDVRGKVVLLLRYAPEGLEHGGPVHKYATLQYKASNAKQRGAEAVLFVTPDTQTEESDISSIGFDRAYLNSGVRAAVLRRGTADELLSFYGKSISELQKLAVAGNGNNSFALTGTVVEFNSDIVYSRGTGSNVLGFLKGADPELSEEVIVVGAHYDHIGTGAFGSRVPGKDEIHNGADDNASGTSGLLELAAYFSANSENLKRSVLFIAFSAEELGLLGSSYYAAHPAIPMQRTVAMLNMDMIGRLNQKDLIVLGTGSSPEWEDIISRANRSVGLDISFNSSSFAPSDQSVFYSKGVPAIQFFTGLHADYHAPGDDWQKINSYGEKLVLELVSKVIWELNEPDSRIAFSKIKGGDSGVSGFKVNLGTIPDYSNDVEGVKLMGVREDSPAQRAGVKGGDIIVEFAGTRVRNIYDYVYALENSRPGVASVLVLLRGGERITLSVTPGPR